MALKRETNPRNLDLSLELRDILQRNGMQAHIVVEGDHYRLAVQGHDSPPLTYNLTERQLLALTDWGNNTANKKAYNVFTSLVGDDFYMPRNFVHARNANSRVAMGLHGYRIGVGEYGRDMWGRDMLGWTPRMQDGFHMRRIGGRVFYQHGAPIVGERPDGRMKPGELQNGGYGFYYKGKSQQVMMEKDPLEGLASVITPLKKAERSTEPAKPYKELITSPVYFSNEKWQEVLSSHGILIDAEKKTMTIQSNFTDIDMVYDLKDEELSKLTSNSVKDVSVQQRLDIINNVIANDFDGKVTMEQLNSKERISLPLKPEVQQSLTVAEQQAVTQSDSIELKTDDRPQYDGETDGRDLQMLNENKGWYREGRHGREVSVEGISVQKSDTGDKYQMTAVINGQAITHDITQKQYDKFLALDDYHRMKLFSDIFKEVDMKTRPESRSGLGSQILGALTAGAIVTAEVAHGFHRPRLEFCEDPHGGPMPRVYGKPGVDMPNEIAARQFEALANRTINEMRNGRGM